MNKAQTMESSKRKGLRCFNKNLQEKEMEEGSIDSLISLSDRINQLRCMDILGPL